MSQSLWLTLEEAFPAAISYLFFGGLLPRPLPDGLPVLLGPFGGVLLAAAACALAAKPPLATLPLLDFASAA